MPLPILMKRFPYGTLTMAALTLAIHFVPSLGQVLQFDRTAIAHGQVWRFFTAHFTHFGDDHLRWDLAAFVILGAITERLSRVGLFAAVAFSAALTSIGVWLFQPQFMTYRGLSGIDSALFGYVIADLLVTGWKDRHRFSMAVGCVALGGFAAKCVFEMITRSTVFVESGGAFTPVPLAHLLGLVAGVAVGCYRKRERSER